MGISFYAKDAEIQQTKDSGWHVWEKVSRGDTKRAEALAHKPGDRRPP